MSVDLKKLTRLRELSQLLLCSAWFHKVVIIYKQMLLGNKTKFNTVKGSVIVRVRVVLKRTVVGDSD